MPTTPHIDNFTGLTGSDWPSILIAYLNAIFAPGGNSVRLSLNQASSVNVPAIQTSAGNALAANGDRKAWSIQNLGTNPLFVRLGDSASNTLFHYVLKACSAQDDGSGGFISGDGTYRGVISVAGTSPRFAAAEMA